MLKGRVAALKALPTLRRNLESTST
jgi:hypothetical protein